MRWKIIVIAVATTVISSLFIYFFDYSVDSTPPPYRFLWELKIVDENESTVVLEIENVSVFAYRDKEFIDISNRTIIPLSSLLVHSYNDTPVGYPFLNSPVKYRGIDANKALSLEDRIEINKIGLRMDDYLNFSMIVVTGYPWERVEYRFGVFGADVADAKIPPPFVKVTPEIVGMIYDGEDHCWQGGDNIPYYIWGIYDLKHLRM